MRFCARATLLPEYFEWSQFISKDNSGLYCMHQIWVLSICIFRLHLIIEVLAMKDKNFCLLCKYYSMVLIIIWLFGRNLCTKYYFNHRFRSYQPSLKTTLTLLQTVLLLLSKFLRHFDVSLGKMYTGKYGVIGRCYCSPKLV